MRIFFLKAAFCLLVLACTFTACSRKPLSTKPSFKDFWGMQYIEVRREFSSGLAFNESGFQQVPSWKMYFLSDDSVKIYNPAEKAYFNYPVYHDHDSVFNIARHWMRLKYASRDSVVFQLLSVEEKKVSRELSNVLMKFYSYNYLHKKLGKTEQEVRKPYRADSLFIYRKCLRANRNPASRDSAFAAPQYATLTSNTPDIEVKKLESEPDKHNLMNIRPSDSYLYPEYSIRIRNAYKDFNHTFSVLIDSTGKMRLGEFLTSEEFVESRKKVLTGIIDIYLQRFLTVKPGTTLGMPHTSEVTLHIKGIK